MLSDLVAPLSGTAEEEHSLHTIGRSQHGWLDSTLQPHGETFRCSSHPSLTATLPSIWMQEISSLLSFLQL